MPSMSNAICSSSNPDWTCLLDLTLRGLFSDALLLLGILGDT